MACDPVTPGADESAGLKRVLGLDGLLGAGILSLLTYLEAAGIGASLGGAGLAILLAAAAGYILGVAIGFAVEWFTRLKGHTPATITLHGIVQCANKDSDYPAPIHDGDWNFNLGTGDDKSSVLFPDGLTVGQVRTVPAPGGAPVFASFEAGTMVPILHCEISSHVGPAAALGTAIGAAAGAVAGAAIGAAVGCLVLGIFTFGLGCLLAILLGALIGAFVGALAGHAVGTLVGYIADELSDFDKKGEGIEAGCVVNFTGLWVTDTGHQHNEIHDIDSIQIIECGVGSQRQALELIAGVGIGRIPTGRDP